MIELEKRDYTLVTTSPGRPYIFEKGQLWRQFVFAAIANISVIGAGYLLGWTSPINIKLQNPALNPLGRAITKEEEAWIGSLLNVGAMCGPFIGSPIATKLGRKWALVTTSVPLAAGFILVTAANSVAYLYAGRIFMGIAVGMIFTVAPMYCVEIATVEARGALGSLLQLFCTLGLLLAFAVGPFVSYNVVSFVGFGVTAALVGAVFIPESPKHCLMNNKREAAAECLMTLRGRSRRGVELELVELTAEINASKDKRATIRDVFRGGNLKAFYISCTLMFFQQFSGINAVLFYTMNIFEAAGSKLDPGIATVIIGIVQVAASGVTSLTIDKAGRKMLLLISTAGTAIALAALGAYFVIDEKSALRVTLSFLPITSLVLFIISYCLGLGPLPWALMSELLPMEVKAVASPIGTMFSWALSFIITR
ncbi:sugar transporter domain-containing protein [Phthorimaea operculella]|nr:sugar transporter domain-containing protein [Phthorimaea operculella]